MALLRHTPLTDESHLELIRRLTRNQPLETSAPPRPLVEPLSRFPAPATLPESFEPLTRNVAPATPSLDTIGAPPVMLLSRDGHAVSATGGASPLDSLQTLARTQESEQPKRESKKMVALRAGLGFLGGGVPGALGTVVGDLSDRRALDRGRIDQNLQRTRGQIGRELAIQNSQNDLANDAATRDYKRAEIRKLDRVPATPQFNISAGQERVEIGPAGQPRVVYSRPPAEKSTAPHNPLLRERKNPDGSTTALQSDDYGKTWKPVEDLGSAAPNEKPTTNNAQLAEWNYKKQREAENAAKDLRQQAASQDLTTYAGQEAQKDLLARAAEAEKNVLKYRDEGDRAAAKPVTRGPRRGGNPSPTTHVLNKQSWLKSHPESDWPKAVAAAKSAGYLIVE